MRRIDGHGFLGNESGAVAATYALTLTALILIAGVGFDYGRLAAMDSELQNGADQAALAGATQLDGRPGACARAAAAAATLVNNPAYTATGNKLVSITPEGGCDASGKVRFWQDKGKSSAATTDANAHFIEVTVDSRSADLAFTAITGVLYGRATATAMAGVGSSICKVPPMMICSPDPGNPFNAAGKKGWGLRATGHGNDGSGGSTVSAWGPGDFGFLEVGAGQTSQLVQSLAFKQVPLDCAPIDGAFPETGNPQSLYDAINTRFDIYDFSSGNGTALASCFNGNCPAASNVVKDLVKRDDGTQGNACRLHNSGWQLPPVNRQFWPKPVANADGSYNDTAHSPAIDAMGLPRDLCHYASFGTACNGGANGKFGNGNWARVDYFKTNHPGGGWPANAATITRYETYKWELAQNNMPNGVSAGSAKQFGRPICSTGTADGIDRRVLTVAVVKNCASLNGSSTKVQVDEWVDVFLVEPVVDARGNGNVSDSVYMEIIGPSRVAGSGVSAAQQVRRDVPYLVE